MAERNGISQRFYGHGKLLLSGEYFVLDGARALALPTRPGQSLQVVQHLDGQGLLEWESLDHQGRCWWRGQFSLPGFELRQTTDPQVGLRLQELLLALRRQNADFLTGGESCQVTTTLEFPRQWGLGSSSTLVHCLAQWAAADPYQLLAETFGGSGYDLACAAAGSPLLFQRRHDQPCSCEVPFRPVFRDHLFFVYLGQKQNSREGIARYRAQVFDDSDLTEKISRLTDAFLEADTLDSFEELIRQHEAIVAQALGLSRAKTLYFADFPGEIKSLGAWGGDFVLATDPYADPTMLRRYFSHKGFDTVLTYEKLLL